jgi:hypothetical protein
VTVSEINTDLNEDQILFIEQNVDFVTGDRASHSLFSMHRSNPRYA